MLPPAGEANPILSCLTVNVENDKPNLLPAISANFGHFMLVVIQYVRLNKNRIL